MDREPRVEVEKLELELEVTAPSVQVIADLLEMPPAFERGASAALSDGVTLTVSDVTTSGEGDTTVLNGFITMALETTGAALTSWLMTRVLTRQKAAKASGGGSAPKLSFKLDGQKLGIVASR